MDSVIPTLSTKVDIERVHTELHKARSEMRAWMLGTILAIVMVVSTVGASVSDNARAPAQGVHANADQTKHTGT